MTAHILDRHSRRPAGQSLRAAAPRRPDSREVTMKRGAMSAGTMTMTAALSQQAPNGAVFKARGLSDSLRKDFVLIAAQTDYFSTIARWAIICYFPWGMRSKTFGIRVPPTRVRHHDRKTGRPDQPAARRNRAHRMSAAIQGSWPSSRQNLERSCAGLCFISRSASQRGAPRHTPREERSTSALPDALLGHFQTPVVAKPARYSDSLFWPRIRSQSWRRMHIRRLAGGNTRPTQCCEA